MTEKQSTRNSQGGHSHHTGMGVLVLFGALCWALKSNGCLPEDMATPFDSNPKARIAKQVAESSAVQVSAETLTRDYRANEVAADKEYKGKVLAVTGRITQIRGGSSGLFGSAPIIHLAAVRCEFKDNAQIEHLSTGQFVTIRGKCQGRGVFRYCILCK
jgi:hypothetical protein